MRKIIILTGSALMLFFSAFAQIEQGKVLAGGSLGFSSSKHTEVDDGEKEDQSNTMYFWLNPRAGFFLTEAIALGAAINLLRRATIYDNDSRYISSSVSLTPFVRYYMAQAIFGQLELGIGGGTDRWKAANGGEDDIDKFKLLMWSLGVGYAYFLNQYVSVEPLISYTANTYTYGDNANFKDKYGIIQFSVGIILYLNCPLINQSRGQ